MPSLRPNPARIGHPRGGDHEPADAGEPLELVRFREQDWGPRAEHLHEVRDRQLHAREAGPLVLGHERLRQLLRREIVDPHAEARHGQEREEQDAREQRRRRRLRVRGLRVRLPRRDAPEYKDHRDLFGSSVSMSS